MSRRRTQTAALTPDAVLPAGALDSAALRALRDAWAQRLEEHETIIAATENAEGGGLLLAALDVVVGTEAATRADELRRCIAELDASMGWT